MITHKKIKNARIIDLCAGLAPPPPVLYQFVTSPSTTSKRTTAEASRALDVVSQKAVDNT